MMAESPATPTARVIRNPILRGFHPDPSILLHGGTYYIATSTFEWFPGVRLHRSRDLVVWESVGYALTRASQLDMLGNPDSGGVWAPDLSQADGSVFLVFTDVKSWGSGIFDAHNYVVSAPSPEGPWSEPSYLNSSGFDPSLFHDDDGRSWLVNMLNDFRLEGESFGGIVLQEFDRSTMQLRGDARVIFRGTPRGVTEGPHLYKHEGRYYLMTAEGGTTYDHQVTVARADRIEGPYEVDPHNPVLTSSHDPNLALQKAGHASLVETPAGEPYLAFLCGRPASPRRLCPLGRETALARAAWTPDGWLRLADGGRAPALEVRAPLGPRSVSEAAVTDGAVEGGAERTTEHVLEFRERVLPDDFQTLRVPLDESWASLRARPGHLRLVGRESLTSRHRQSLVARRRQAFACEVETTVEASPRSFQQLAGLAAYYDTRNFVYLHVTHEEGRGRVAALLQADAGRVFRPRHEPLDVPGDGPVGLRMTFEHDVLRCFVAREPGRWTCLGPAFDAALLSDEYDGLGFTGTYLGMAAHDLAGSGFTADFATFVYREGAGRLERTAAAAS